MMQLYPRIKISVITDISILQLYRYIGDIMMDILENFLVSLKFIKIYENTRKIL